LSAVSDWLFNIFAATVRIWRLSTPSATWKRAIPWWQGHWHLCSWSRNLLRLYITEVYRCVKRNCL